MLSLRSKQAFQVLVAIIIIRDHPANAQCEVHRNAKLFASDAGPGDGFGSSVSVSGEVAVVAADRAGAAYVYRFDGSDWVQQAKLTDSDTGIRVDSVSVSGDTIVVGKSGSYCQDGASFNCGAAYIYRFNGGTWVEEQRLTPLEAAQDDYFGFSVSVGGDVVIVGAYGADVGFDPSVGAAYVYRSDDGTWVEEQKLAPSGTMVTHYFGQSVSVSGDTAVVGARYGNRAYVYRFDGSHWVEQAELTVSDLGTYDYFGHSVSVSGDSAVIGTYWTSAYVFVSDGITWRQQAKLTPPGTTDVGFGTSVSVAGNIAVVGAPGEGCRCGSGCGAAYVFRFNGSTWVEVNKLTGWNAAGGDSLGHSVGVSGDTAVVGARVGSAYAFPLAFPDCNNNGILDATDIVGGYSKDLNGDGIPDECEAPPPGIVVWNPNVLSVERTTRSLRFRVQPSAAATATPSQDAIKITMVDLQNPNPPNLPGRPPPDFSAYECATCEAVGDSVPPSATGEGCCARWVGKPGTFLESQNSPQVGNYRAARLQCTPFYFDWITETTSSPINVVGAEIVPSSTYSVQTYGATCRGSEAGCINVSAAVAMITRRFGDVASAWNPPATNFQPDALDVTALVNSFRGRPGAPVKAIAQIQPNLPELNTDVNALDIVAAVDAVKDLAYAFSGPCPCPSQATCNALACSTHSTCSGSSLPGLGAGAMCVFTCTGGDNDGEPCINDSDCPGGGSCGNGFCRDRCGRCTL